MKSMIFGSYADERRFIWTKMKPTKLLLLISSITVSYSCTRNWLLQQSYNWFLENKVFKTRYNTSKRDIQPGIAHAQWH